jgi:hypothetical protein
MEDTGVANIAPKKRPPNPRSDRRSPRGHFTVPTSNDLRHRLTAAATKLREINEPGLADAIDIALSPSGWGQLRRTDPTVSGVSGGGDAMDRNMAMRMPREWREQIKERVQAAGNTLTQDVNEGLQKYLDGLFEPLAPGRNPYGSGVDMVNLNVRPKDELRVAVPQQEAGHSAALVGAAYLMSKYKVGPYAPKKPAKK